QRVIGKQAREDFVLIADLPVSAIRECGNSLAAEGAREQDQLIRIIDRQHFQQHGVNQAEDRRVGPDAQRQREQGNASKAAMLQQHPHAITQVLKHFVLQYWETRRGDYGTNGKDGTNGSGSAVSVCSVCSVCSVISLELLSTFSS